MYSLCHIKAVPCAFIILVTLLVAIRDASLPISSKSRSTTSASLDFVSQARGIAFHGGATSVGYHFTCYLMRNQGLDLNCVMDVAVKASEAWAPC